VFFEWNITQVVFLAWKPTRPQVEWVSQPRKPRVWYFHSKNTRVPFSVYHMPLLRVGLFWGIFSSNRRKFNSEIQDPKFSLDVTRREQWRDYVTMTLRRQEQWCHLGPSFGGPTICMTSLRSHDVYHNAAVWYNRAIRKKYCTVGLHAWQWQKFCRNVRIKLVCRVWNRFQWCPTNRSPNNLGF
jgi:hypothetical protein